MAAIVGALCPPRNNLPAAMVLPEKLVHMNHVATWSGEGYDKSHDETRRSNRALV
jgi:hypothetical protein